LDYREDWWNDGIDLVIPLFGAASGAVGGGAASTGGAGCALKLPADGKGGNGHNPANFLALTFGTGNLF